MSKAAASIYCSAGCTGADGKACHSVLFSGFGTPDQTGFCSAECAQAICGNIEIGDELFSVGDKLGDALKRLPDLEAASKKAQLDKERAEDALRAAGLQKLAFEEKTGEKLPDRHNAVEALEPVTQMRMAMAERIMDLVVSAKTGAITADQYEAQRKALADELHISGALPILARREKAYDLVKKLMAADQALAEARNKAVKAQAAFINAKQNALNLQNERDKKRAEALAARPPAFAVPVPTPVPAVRRPAFALPVPGAAPVAYRPAFAIPAVPAAAPPPTHGSKLVELDARIQQLELALSAFDPASEEYAKLAAAKERLVAEKRTEALALLASL